MSVLVYWLARTAIFVGCVALLWTLGWWDVLSVIAAFVVAWLVSYLALPGLRRRAALQMEGWLSRTQERHHTDDVDEDAEADRPAR
jgi:divalent metal cation (Fe/Co/Zn/Cd) transporter